MWVEALHDDYEGLRILLKGNGSAAGVLRITFVQYFIKGYFKSLFRQGSSCPRQAGFRIVAPEKRQRLDKVTTPKRARVPI